MADEDDGFALGRHRSERGEKHADFLGGEDGGGLVHDQDLRAAVEHFQNLNPLLFTDTELPDLGAGVHLHSKALPQVGDFPVVLGEIENKARRIQPEEDIFGHALRWHQHKMLVDHADAGFNGVARGVELHLNAVDKHTAGILTIEAGEDIHQRAFTGAIFSQQGVDFTPIQDKIDVIIGEHAGKALHNPAHFYNRRSGG